MILYPLLVSLALAGGPAISKAHKNKRSLATEYVAITSYPDPSKKYAVPYCLRNMGASMAGLEGCLRPNLNDAMSLFTFEPAPG